MGLPTRQPVLIPKRLAAGRGLEYLAKIEPTHQNTGIASCDWELLISSLEPRNSNGLIEIRFWLRAGNIRQTARVIASETDS